MSINYNTTDHLFTLMEVLMVNNLLAVTLSGATVDIICLVILTLFAVICMFRGFTKQIFGLVTAVIAFLIAYFLADNLLTLFNNWWNLTENTANKINIIFSGNEFFNMELTADNIDKFAKSVKLPGFIVDYAIKHISETIPATTVGTYISTVIAKHVLTGICFITLFIISKIILSILKFILLLFVKLPIIHGIDKILGLVLGIIKGILFLYVAIFLCSLIPTSIESFNGIREAINSSIIASFMQNYNLFAIIIEKLVSAINI